MLLQLAREAKVARRLRPRAKPRRVLSQAPVKSRPSPVASCQLPERGVDCRGCLRVLPKVFKREGEVVQCNLGVPKRAGLERRHVEVDRAGMGAIGVRCLKQGVGGVEDLAEESGGDGVVSR